MVATPIIPGKLYEVKCNGHKVAFYGTNGIDAIMNAMKVFFKEEN